MVRYFRLGMSNVLHTSHFSTVTGLTIVPVHFDTYICTHTPLLWVMGQTVEQVLYECTYIHTYIRTYALYTSPHNTTFFLPLFFPLLIILYTYHALHSPTLIQYMHVCVLSHITFWRHHHHPHQKWSLFPPFCT